MSVESRLGSASTALLVVLSALGGNLFRWVGGRAGGWAGGGRAGRCGKWAAAQPLYIHTHLPPPALSPAASALGEAPCLTVAGASGAIFGLAGALLGELLTGWARLRRPLLGSVIMLTILLLFTMGVGTTPTGTSHLSHAGGLVCGLLGALALTPRHPRRLRWGTAAALAALLGTLLALFYALRLPGIIHC